MRSLREEFAVTSIALDMSKDLIATGCYSENKINFWKITEQVKVKTVTFDKAFNPINSIMFFQGKVAFIANSAANVVILEGESFQELRKLSKHNNREIIAIDAAGKSFLVACQRPLLQTLSGQESVKDILIYDTDSWIEKYALTSGALLFDAKLCNKDLITIGLDDQDGSFKINFLDLENLSNTQLVLDQDAYTAQLTCNESYHLAAVILRVNNDQDGTMISTLLIIDSNAKKVIYRNSVSDGNDYLNCKIIDHNNIVLDYYDHQTRSSYLTVIDSQGTVHSKRRIDGITTYGIATAPKIVALAVNNYVEFVELS